MAMRKITAKEVEQINKIIRPRFGPKSQVQSGSCEMISGGITKYHLVIGDPVNPPADENLKGIGKILKEKWDTNAEYYSFGKKIS